MANWSYNKVENSRTGRYSNRLDLHGVRHHEVELLVENFILTNQDNVPLTIVCGNSVKMVSLVSKVCNRIGCAIVDNTVFSKIIIRKI